MRKGSGQAYFLFPQMQNAVAQESPDREKNARRNARGKCDDRECGSGRAANFGYGREGGEGEETEKGKVLYP